MTHFRLLLLGRRHHRRTVPPTGRVPARPRDRERGVALLSALLVTMLMAALLIGFTALVTSDSRMRGLSNSRSQAFYAAQAGLEKLTADLGDLFLVDFAPTAAQVNALTTTPPALQNTQWLAPDGSSGYTITFPTVGGQPAAQTRTIESGPWQGFIGLVTPYTLTVTARMNDGSEASLTRSEQTVSIPVFQFGMFSQSDLSFFAGPAFNFGGRVHTNGNLYLASKATLTMSDRVTAAGEVVRKVLSNGWDATSDYIGNVRILTAPGAYRNLAFTEGSVVTDAASAKNEPTWTNLSLGTYNHNIMNGRTGARVLNLPITSFGAQPIDLIKRPAPGEDIANPQVYGQRYFSQVSVRILLSDTAADILNLPGVTADPPVPLGNLATTPVAGYTVDATHPPFAISGGVAANGERTPAGTPLLGGFIKIEHQLPAGGWQDVTLEILNLGIAGRNLANACAEPNANAVIRIERLQDNTSSCGDAGTTTATKYWPNVLYDAREGALRDNANGATTPYFGGVMHYIELDIGNLNRWLSGAIGVNGVNTAKVTGYSVYFSDRRGNRNAANQETGEYGFEDFVNPASSAGTPNNGLDTGEDVNGDGVLETYGETPQLPAGATAPLVAATRPWTLVDATNNTLAGNIARRNPSIFFRRALKLTDGQAGSLPMPGLAVVSENPVYVQGNYNASAAGFTNPDSADSIIADALTLLSSNWNDRTSFTYPHSATNRNAATTWYRFGVIAGKQLSFPRPGSEVEDFGTDGGAHNFLRYLEDWSGQTLNFRGAIATLSTSRQAVGTYKCCTSVYSPPTRGYNFDVNFLQPSLLPPLTPMFRDVNTTGFTQVIRPQ